MLPSASRAFLCLIALSFFLPSLSLTFSQEKPSGGV